MTGICPCCGYDVANDEPITRPEISMKPYGDCYFHGQPIRLTAAERAVIWALLKADGRPLSRATIAERVGYEGEDFNTIDVYMSRIRAKLRRVSPEIPIENIRGAGLRWAA